MTGYLLLHKDECLPAQRVVSTHWSTDLGKVAMSAIPSNSRAGHFRARIAANMAIRAANNYCTGRRVRYIGDLSCLWRLG